MYSQGEVLCRNEVDDSEPIYDELAELRTAVNDQSIEYSLPTPLSSRSYDDHRPVLCHRHRTDAQRSYQSSDNSSSLMSLDQKSQLQPATTRNQFNSGAQDCGSARTTNKSGIQPCLRKRSIVPSTSRFAHVTWNDIPANQPHANANYNGGPYAYHTRAPKQPEPFTGYRPEKCAHHPINNNSNNVYYPINNNSTNYPINNNSNNVGVLPSAHQKPMPNNMEQDLATGRNIFHHPINNNSNNVGVLPSAHQKPMPNNMEQDLATARNGIDAPVSCGCCGATAINADQLRNYQTTAVHPYQTNATPGAYALGQSDLQKSTKQNSTTHKSLKHGHEENQNFSQNRISKSKRDKKQRKREKIVCTCKQRQTNSNPFDNSKMANTKSRKTLTLIEYGGGQTRHSRHQNKPPRGKVIMYVGGRRPKSVVKCVGCGRHVQGPTAIQYRNALQELKQSRNSDNLRHRHYQRHQTQSAANAARLNAQKNLAHARHYK